MIAMHNLIMAAMMIAALGSALMAGLFFAFSNFVMSALSRLSPDKGIAAMQAINVVILNPLFFLVFFGTTAASAGALTFSMMRWQAPEAPFLLIGGLLHLGGVFLVTMICNVPRNNALAPLTPMIPPARVYGAVMFVVGLLGTTSGP